jgi:hypothetical protein
MAMAPILARHLFQTDWRRRIGLLPGARQQTSRPRPLLNLLTIAVMCVVVLVSSPWLQPKLYGTSLLDPQTPVAAMDYIERHGLQGRIFHPQVFGDYLIWRLWPRHRSFFDGRVHLFGEPFVQRYRQLRGPGDWEKEFAAFDIRYLLLHKDPEDKNGRAMIDWARESAGSRLLHEDSVSVLFELRNGKATLAER